MKNYKISEEFIFNNIFFLFLIFQATTLKYNLGIESVSFIFNGILYLLPISILIFKLPQSSINRYEALIFTLLFFIIFISYVNLFLQGISYMAFVQTMSFTYPWLVFLTVIVSREYILNNIAKYWSWFNSFIVILTFLGLIEYIALFFFGVTPPLIKTQYGDFFIGYATIFHAIGDTGLAHFRFYGPFNEPGNFSMWASLLLVYNIFRKNNIYSIILMIGIFSAFSPSVIPTLAIAFCIYCYKRKSWKAMGGIFITISAIFIYKNQILDNINLLFVTKSTSLGFRFSETIGFFNKFGELLINHPIGIPFFSTSAEKYASGVGFAANFTPIGAYDQGGLIVFLIYVFFLLLGIFLSIRSIIFTKAKLINLEIYIYYLMLMTYIPQRSTIFEFGVFSMLFGGVFLKNIYKDKLQNQKYIGY